MKLPVYTLCGTSTFDASVICLRSLARHCRDPIQLHLVSDGTLSPAQVAELCAASGALEARVADVAGEKAKLMRGLDRLDKFDRDWPYFKKVIDIPLLAPDTFRFIDSDIYFFRDFSGLFVPGEARQVLAEDAAVNIGIKDLFSIRQPVLAEANSGIIQGPRLDLAQADALIPRFRDTKIHIVEQCLYAYAYAARPTYMVPRSRVYIARRRDSIEQSIRICRESGACGFHLTSWRKGEAARIEQLLPAMTEHVPMQLPLFRPKTRFWYIVLKFVYRASGRA